LKQIPRTKTMPTQMSATDRCLKLADTTLRTLFGPRTAAGRPMPATAAADSQALTDAQRRLSGALMRVNHVGEVCAQALYQAQAVAARDPALRSRFEQAAREEQDHLAWTRQRLDELDARPSLLNPLWFGGAFAIGLLAARLGDRASLGFVVETERQVEAHLASHLERLPVEDLRSRQIVERMKQDEAAHARQAMDAGARALPAPLPQLMRAAAGVMTRTAHHL
jgi:3-demethoxyubiquinol 3-hydroxylase